MGFYDGLKDIPWADQPAWAKVGYTSGNDYWDYWLAYKSQYYSTHNILVDIFPYPEDSSQDGYTWIEDLGGLRLDAPGYSSDWPERIIYDDPAVTAWTDASYIWKVEDVNPDFASRKARWYNEPHFEGQSWNNNPADSGPLPGVGIASTGQYCRGSAITAHTDGIGFHHTWWGYNSTPTLAVQQGGAAQWDRVDRNYALPIMGVHMVDTDARSLKFNTDHTWYAGYYGTNQFVGMNMSSETTSGSSDVQSDFFGLKFTNRGVCEGLCDVNGSLVSYVETPRNTYTGIIHRINWDNTNKGLWLSYRNSAGTHIVYDSSSTNQVKVTTGGGRRYHKSRLWTQEYAHRTVLHRLNLTNLEDKLYPV